MCSVLGSSGFCASRSRRLSLPRLFPNGIGSSSAKLDGDTFSCEIMGFFFFSFRLKLCVFILSARQHSSRIRRKADFILQINLINSATLALMKGFGVRRYANCVKICICVYNQSIFGFLFLFLKCLLRFVEVLLLLSSWAPDLTYLLLS